MNNWNSAISSKMFPSSYWKKKVEDEGTKRATQVKKRSVVKIMC